MNIAIVYGGKSYEHDISILTAIECMGRLSATQYSVYPIYRKNETFYMPNEAMEISTYRNFDENQAVEVSFSRGCMYIVKGKKAKQAAVIDCVMLATHGGEGENGELSAYFKTVGIATTSYSAVALGITMDKCLTKRFLRELGVPVLPSVEVRKENITLLESCPPFPVIVKPSRLGSSIGISIAQNPEELEQAILSGFEYDGKLLIEKAIKNRREVNLASYRRGKELIHSILEEPVGADEILSFKDKYLVGAKNDCGRRIFAPDIASKHRELIYSTNEHIYRELELSGVVRIDYIIDCDEEEIYVSEINAIPGSLATYLFKKVGISEQKLYTDLIEEGIKSLVEEKNKKLIFESKALYGGVVEK